MNVFAFQTCIQMQSSTKPAFLVSQEKKKYQHWTRMFVARGVHNNQRTGPRHHCTPAHRIHHAAARGLKRSLITNFCQAHQDAVCVCGDRGLITLCYQVANVKSHDFHVPLKPRIGAGSTSGFSPSLRNSGSMNHWPCTPPIIVFVRLTSERSISIKAASIRGNMRDANVWASV